MNLQELSPSTVDVNLEAVVRAIVIGREYIVVTGDDATPYKLVIAASRYAGPRGCEDGMVAIWVMFVRMLDWSAKFVRKERGSCHHL